MKGNNNNLKLTALNYVEKNKLNIKAMQAFIDGYEEATTDLENISLENFKEVCKIIVARRIKIVSNEFYDPNMGLGRRKEIEEKIKKLENMLNSILDTKLV
jgi:hypothetical protein